jgi:hypothetical protein
MGKWALKRTEVRATLIKKILLILSNSEILFEKFVSSIKSVVQKILPFSRLCVFAILLSG